VSAFPRDFVWGAATAAYQIEGATNVDGRGESIWDRFCRTPGKVENGDTGDRACEHYTRWADDVELMGALGLQGYRFSISWPRIQPTGSGAPNRKGLDFYRRLADGLLTRGITPLATLYHWDLPQALEDGGGWTSREVVERFEEYAGIVFDGLGDLVGDWITHNEPWVTSFLGYAHGTKAPGLRDWGAAVAASHHALLAHGAAVRRFRSSGLAGRIGITLDLTVAEPASESPEDRAAAQRLDGHHNRWFLDPIFDGAYPEDMLALYEARCGQLEAIRPDDLPVIAAPIDFLGVNFYRPNLVAADASRPPLELREAERHAERTAMGWPIVPAALTELLLRLGREHPEIPLVVTENGAAFHDVLDGADVVEDPRRRDYLEQHIAAVGRAIEGGADVTGYYAWSLLDNFEWEHGYSQRFGLVYVDYPTQRRVLKRSALWYRDLIARAGDGRS
jgi:beta-glucosidase